MCYWFITYTINFTSQTFSTQLIVYSNVKQVLLLLMVNSTECRAIDIIVPHITESIFSIELSITSN